MQKKKTVLFIVEGPSDKAALEKIFRKIYRNSKNIDFRFTGGDISSDEKTNTDNVCDKINDVVNEYLKSSKLIRSDIFQIVQIFDMDGAYIPEAFIKKGVSEKFTYSLTSISCKHIERVKIRNERKMKLMDYLLGIDFIKSIPYEMYFMSCNLDHVLYNEQNLDPMQKQAYADEFYECFMDKEKLFIDFLETDLSNNVPTDHKASWKFIKQGLHSLERHTNLHIYFKEHPIL